MIVWVKELKNILTMSGVSVWFKKDITLKPYDSISSVDISDIIVISKSDPAINEIDHQLHIIMIYEDFFDRITKNIIKEHLCNYDYYYIKNALSHSNDPQIDTIITGSSYGVFGIDANIASHSVNLSLLSQDPYYDAKSVYEVYKKNQHIKNVVLCCGYYYFSLDLSRTQNVNELLRITKVYKPLYHDINNCYLLPPKQDILYESNIFDIPKILTLYTEEQFEKHYFHTEKTRKSMANKQWDDHTKNWSDLTEAEKDDAARKRAFTHNRGQKRNVSYEQNRKIFLELSSFCSKNHINLLVVVTPTTDYYQKYLYSGFKNMFYEVLNESEDVIHLLDLTNNPSFEDSDFIDMDHLDDSGAVKMTYAIQNMLQEINNQ